MLQVFFLTKQKKSCSEQIEFLPPLLRHYIRFLAICQEPFFSKNERATYFAFLDVVAGVERGSVAKTRREDQGQSFIILLMRETFPGGLANANMRIFLQALQKWEPCSGTRPPGQRLAHWQIHGNDALCAQRPPHL